MRKRNGSGIDLLADPTRRAIVALLALGHGRPSRLAAEIGLEFAGPSEVLISEITASLARDAGVDLEDPGEHQLRGLSRTDRLFAVVPGVTPDEMSGRRTRS